MSAGGEPPRDSRDGSGSCGDRSSRAVIDQVAVPACAEYARATEELGPAIERHCMGTAPADAAAVRTAFDETMDAWQRAWPFTFGPAMQDAGRTRIAFRPDRRGSAARQMRTVLRTRDEALLDAGTASPPIRRLEQSWCSPGAPVTGS